MFGVRLRAASKQSLDGCGKSPRGEQEETETNSRDLHLFPLCQTRPSLLPRSGLPFFISPREFWKERRPSSLKAGDVRWEDRESEQVSNGDWPDSVPTVSIQSTYPSFPSLGAPYIPGSREPPVAQHPGPVCRVAFDRPFEPSRHAPFVKQCVDPMPFFSFLQGRTESRTGDVRFPAGSGPCFIQTRHIHYA